MVMLQQKTLEELLQGKDKFDNLPEELQSCSAKVPLNALSFCFLQRSEVFAVEWKVFLFIRSKNRLKSPKSGPLFLLYMCFAAKQVLEAIIFVLLFAC
jgi:hypothetical protein